MSGVIFQGATEISFGERDGRVAVTFLRSGDLSASCRVTYDVTTDTATLGGDVLGGSGTVQFAPGQDRAQVFFTLRDDALREATESFAVSLVSVDSGSLSVPRTCRVNILDDENPVLPPVEPTLASPYVVSTHPLVEGLSNPTNMEFSPLDPSLAYVAEKGGLVRVVNVETGADRGVFIDLRDQVNAYGDRGLLDIALHPDFENNPYLYAFYVVDPPGAAAQGIADRHGNRYAQLVRFTADAEADHLRVVPGSGVVLAGGAGRTLADINGGGTLDFSSPTHASLPSSERYTNPTAAQPPVVVNGIKQDYIKVDSMTHAGGALAFGPDGALYVSIGDGGSPNYTDPHNVDVQDLNSLSGKILRLDPLTGQGLPDNPFHQPGQSLDLNISKVYQLGLRNPFSMAFDATGNLFITDTGWNSYEEINTGPAGTNFGWPWFEGREGGVSAQTTGYKSLPDAAAFYAGVNNGTIFVKPPYAAFGHSAAAPGYQVQAVTGGSFVYDGTRYPTAFQRDYFFSDFSGGRAFTVDTTDRTQVDFLYTATSDFAPVHYVQGLDGFVYYVDYGSYDAGSTNGGIGRLYIFEPGVPVVTAQAGSISLVEGGPGAQVTFTLDAAQAAPVTLTYSTLAGTAGDGTDYRRLSEATVVIAAGQTSATVLVSQIDDLHREDVETFSVRPISATLDGEHVAVAGSTTLTIRDNDGGQTARTAVTMTSPSFTAPDGRAYQVTGTRNADVIVTGMGDDVVIGGGGNDAISTGAGRDIIEVSGASAGIDAVNGGAGFDSLRAVAANTVIRLSALSGVEEISATGFAGVQVVATTAADVLDLRAARLLGIAGIDMAAGDDTLWGTAGRDRLLLGGTGNDTVEGGAGNDTIDGGSGNDMLAGGDGDDTFVLTASAGIDVISGGAGIDVVTTATAGTKVQWTSLTGVEFVRAAAGNVTLLGSVGADVIDHAATAWSGLALVDGGNGDDLLRGGGEADRLAGRAGADTLSGGGGRDAFVFLSLVESRTTTLDTILDFRPGEDVIDLAAIDANSTLAGNQAFTFIGGTGFGRVGGELRAEMLPSEGQTRIQADLTSDGRVDMEIRLAGLLTLSRDDFVL